MNKPLTGAQSRVLKFVRDYIREEHFPPTRAEIARALEFASPNAAEEHLRAIAAKGYLTIKSGIARGLIVNDSATGCQ